MKILQKHIYVQIFALLFFTSCNSQVKTQTLKESHTQQKTLSDIHTKIFKTQPSTLYDNINCGLQDKAGNLWFSVAGGNINGQPQGQGVYRYDGKAFINFTVKNGLVSNCVRAMLEDKKGNIWFATNKGICYYDGKTIQQISKLSNPGFQFTFSKSSNLPLINDAYSIMQDKKGFLWFGTSDGVVCYDGNNFTRFLDNHNIANDSSLTLKSVQCMFEDKNGNLWFGSGPMAFEGIAFFDGKTLTKFKPQNETWVRKITEDRKGTLLFNTRHWGMITYNGKTFSDYAQPQNLRRELLNTILADNKGNIWYASDYTNDNDITTGGLWKYDGKSFIEFTKKDGLSNTSTTFILEDRNGNIWVGTRNSGLYKYDGKIITNYSE